MSDLSNLKLSVLDLASIQEGSSISQTFANSRALAQHVELLGYNRLWLAEHHNLAGIASSATAVLIGNIAGATKTLRIGSGGVMLPNHAPLVIAEQFGTLEALYPGRIDLGLGRAPGTDGLTMRALRRDHTSAEDFPEQLQELLEYLGPTTANQRVQAIPGQGSNVPVWLLGSSTFSAQLAAMVGLPFAFAGQFAPAQLFEAFRLYQTQFEPSKFLTTPYAMLGLNIVAAPTDEEAEYLASTMYQKFLGMVRGRRGLAKPPVENLDWTPEEKQAVSSFTAASIFGGPETVRKDVEELVVSTGVQELMINSDVFDQEKRRDSFRIIAEALR